MSLTRLNLRLLPLFRWLGTGTALAMATASPLASASGFGVYDPRTLALGGTSIAMGDLATGHLYNPALTALHRGHEDRTSDGYHSILATVGSVSAGARTASGAITDNLEERLYEAIDRFNAAPNPDSAVFGERAALQLRDAMDDLAEGEIFADGYLGYTVSEPGDGEGGAFFVGARMMGGGIAQVAPGDVALVEDYVEALQFFRSGGMEGEAHPELFDANDGSLRSPRSEIRSAAEARAMLLIEFGVSAAKTWTLLNRPLTVGAAPKVVVAGLFHEQWQVVEDEFSSAGSDSRKLYFNVDLGSSVQLSDSWRLGLAVKDALPKSFRSSLGHEFKLSPLPRMGLAYEIRRLQVGMDVDLLPVQSVHEELARQDVSVGAEFLAWSALRLRLGYRHDFHGQFGGMAAAGVGVEWGAFSFDLAYADGSGGTGVALRLGIRQ